MLSLYDIRLICREFYFNFIIFMNSCIMFYFIKILEFFI